MILGFLLAMRITFAYNLAQLTGRTLVKLRLSVPKQVFA